MVRLFTVGAARVITLAVFLGVGGCGGPAGLDTSTASLAFIDGPADHVVGGPIPPFRVWVLDVHDRRNTGLQGGTLTLDLIEPGGTVQQGFATVTMSFGQGTIVPTLSLASGSGYSVRARFEDTTSESPPFSVVSGPDVVRLTNPSAGEVGMVVDGTNNIGPLQDAVYTTTTSEADVGVLNSGSSTQAVAVFAPDRRPELVPVTWTSAVDVLSIDLRDPIALPITVWIIGGTFATQKANIEAALAQLGGVWRGERAGVTAGDIEFMDATAQATDFEIFAIGLGAPFGPLQTGVGRAAGRFNIYVVSEIRENNALSDGFAEQGGTALAVATDALASAGTRTLGHEFGHNFGLRDTPNVPGFELDGNMMTLGDASTVLTEGQTFRAHFDRFSALRSFRSGDTFQTLTCDPVEATTHCPDLALRVWPESQPAPSLSPGSGGSARR